MFRENSRSGISLIPYKMPVRPASKKHVCSLNIGSDSMLPKRGGKKHPCHKLHKLNLIALHHPESEKHFISYPAIVAERQRQLLEGGPWLIHPFSLLSLVWNSFMCVINSAFTIVAPLRFSYIFPSDRPENTFIDHFLLVLQIVVFIDIVIRFNTGYSTYKENYIVMNRFRIVCHYLWTWFFVDFLSCLPLGYLIPWLQVGHKCQMFLVLLPCIRCLRCVTILQDLRVTSKVLKHSFLIKRIIRCALLFCLSMHWCSCVLYLAPQIQFYWTEKVPESYCRFLQEKHGLITNTTLWHRYELALLISCAAFFATGYSLFISVNSDEIVIYALVILYASVFMVYTVVVLLKIYMTIFSTKMRYQELINQAEKYMRQKQFPAQMKNRLRVFYKYRYQERYFKEFSAMECLSEQLRNEITLDTCHKLIDKVSLFEGVPPSVVGTVLGCLKPEVYMPNDLIMAAGDEGHCMYFIASGTVAVYSLRGAEVCHLEDGAHFGEVALLMKDRKRVVTIVALEITQVYRLGDNDFREFIMTYQDLSEKIEMLASKRMHQTVLIDEATHRLAFQSSFSEE